MSYTSWYVHAPLTSAPSMVLSACQVLTLFITAGGDVLSIGTSHLHSQGGFGDKSSSMTCLQLTAAVGVLSYTVHTTVVS